MDDENMYDDDYDDENYYDDEDCMDVIIEAQPTEKIDREEARVDCLGTHEVEWILNECVAALSCKNEVSPSLARMILHVYDWDVDKVAALIKQDKDGLLKNCNIKPNTAIVPSDDGFCVVCADDSNDQMLALECNHKYCVQCWKAHIEARLMEGIASRLPCMDPSCNLICSYEFVQKILDKPSMRARFERFIFRDYVYSHPELKFCVGKDCTAVIRSRETKAKKARCNKCKTTFCVICGVDYHAPTSCETIKQWLIKCADDSETANYISAHTKDCPRCHTCIEKNGGCNHMQCTKCKHHFCWMCFGDWKNHGSEYYECSRYKENPSVAAEANHVKARRALEKYLHYYERFENHNKSLKMEEQLREKIRKKIDARVNDHDGTWIDWQYLLGAVSLLAKCRYTLQYTYPFAYYLDNGPRKQLFEYQQAQLEKEVEELAWAVERADATARGTLEGHMHRAEHKRQTLLADFFY